MSIFSADLDSVFFRDFAVLISVSTAPLIQAKAILDNSNETVFDGGNSSISSTTLTFTIKSGSLPALKNGVQLLVSQCPGSLVTLSELHIPAGKITVEYVQPQDDGLLQKIYTSQKS